MTVAYYPAIIERGTDGFGVYFPDLPGCTSAGDTMQEAARNAEAALQGHVELSAEYGDDLPRPSMLDTLAVDADVQVAARLLVRVELSDRAVQVSIMLPEDLLATVDRYAQRMGYTRSALLAQTVRERLQRDSEPSLV